MQIEVLNSFKREFKSLLKKDKNLKEEYIKFVQGIKENKNLGTHLGKGVYKARLQNKSNNKGKSAGYRVITYAKLDDLVVFVYIYSKSDLDSISIKKTNELIDSYLTQD